MNPARVVAIVSSDPSDLYFANQLATFTNVVGIFVEGGAQIKSSSTSVTGFTKKYRSIRTIVGKAYSVLLQRYYAAIARRIAYQSFGGDGHAIRTDFDHLVFQVPTNSLNDTQTISLIADLQPDIIALCGCSIVREPILSLPNLGVLNLHGGLSQWYRGVWTTLWAIYNEEPEYVGFTVHYVSPGIDDGNIIVQGRPVISGDDNHESLYGKIVRLGVSAMIEIIQRHQDEPVPSHPLPSKGRLYESRMVTPFIVRKTWRNVRAGIIRDYANNPKELPLIGSAK